MTLETASLQALLASVPDPIYVYDREGRYAFVNPAAARELRRPAEQIVGRTWQQLGLPAEIMEDFDRHRATVLATGQPLVRDLLGPWSNRREEYSLSPVRGADGAVEGVVAIVRDITLREQVAARQRVEADLARLRESEAQRQRVLDATPAMIWMADAAQRGTFFNATWLRFRGRSAAEELGAGWIEGLHPDERDAVLERFRDAFARREAFVVEYRLRRHDGVYRWIADHGVPLTSGPSFEGFIGAAFDTSERHQVEQEREELLVRERDARARAEAADRLKNDWLAAVSHELRTPLNAVLGWSRILKTTEPDARTLSRGLTGIDRNAAALHRLVEDLLDSSSIASGQLVLHPQITSINTAVSAVADDLRSAAETRGVELVLQLDPRTGAVLADPNRLQQIVWNLVQNAIKFSPPGSRVVVESVGGRDSVQLYVRDRGQGFDAAFRPHLFERFRQADSSTSRAHGGLGLGLSIVRHLVELHGGAVDGASEGPGAGASFTVTLPRGPGVDRDAR